MIDPLLFNVQEEESGERIEMGLSDNRPTVVQCGEGGGGERSRNVYPMMDPLLFNVEKEEVENRGYKWVYPMIDPLLLTVVKEDGGERMKCVYSMIDSLLFNVEEAQERRNRSIQ